MLLTVSGVLLKLRDKTSSLSHEVVFMPLEEVGSDLLESS